MYSYHMISSAIWNKEARVNFSKTNKIARARKASAIWGSERFTSAYLFQIASEKSCDFLLMIYMKKKAMVKQKKRTTQSAKIEPYLVPSRARLI